MKIKSFLVRSLANLQFAIVLLLTIAGLSTLGSIIEQNQSIEFYQKNYSSNKVLNYSLITNLGLDHIFTTWWFTLLLFIFGASLICCTFLQQLPILTSARQFKFYNSENKFNSLPFKNKTVLISNGSLIKILENSNYQTFQKFKTIYAKKGIVGRISPIIVHFSMVLILSGTVLASFAGFVAQEFVPETEMFHLQNFLTTNVNHFVPKISGRINDFWIVYKDDESIKQFYTDLSILDNQGYELKRETIYINHPLKYEGLTFYQTDWDIIGLRIKVNNKKPYQIPILKPTKKIWIASIPASFKSPFLDSNYTLLNSSIRGSSPIYDNLGKLIGNTEINEPISNLQNIKLCDYINATGIQIKSDPGLVIIYFGFFLLLISISTSYISYSQIWFTKFSNRIIVGGFTNRAKTEFEFEILNFALQFQNLDNLKRRINDSSY